jgi:hypothetical protein
VAAASGYDLQVSMRLDMPAAAETAKFAAVHPVDVTGDGRDDLVALAVDRGPGELPAALLYVARAEGSFDAPVAFPYAGGAYEGSQVVDLEGDGRRELVVFGRVDEPGTSPSGSPTDSALVMASAPLARSGLGPFRYRTVTRWSSERISYSFNQAVISLPVLVDIDGDRDLDVAYVSTFTGMAGRYTDLSLDVRIFDAGSREYSSLHTASIAWVDGRYFGAKTLVAGDFSGDGIADVAISHGAADPYGRATTSVGMPLEVWSLQGGRLTKLRSLAADATSAYADARLADLDRDGRQDLVFARLVDGRVEPGVLGNVAAATPEPPRFHAGAAATDSSRPVVQRIDGDRLLDVARLLRTPGGRWSVMLHLQDSTGLTMRSSGEFGVAPPTWQSGAVAFGDTDGDRCREAVVAEGGRLWVLQGRGCAPFGDAPPVSDPLPADRAP